jgi:hypothetical protein
MCFFVHSARSELVQVVSCPSIWLRNKSSTATYEYILFQYLNAPLLFVVGGGAQIYFQHISVDIEHVIKLKNIRIVYYVC